MLIEKLVLIMKAIAYANTYKKLLFIAINYMCKISKICQFICCNCCDAIIENYVTFKPSTQIEVFQNLGEKI